MTANGVGGSTRASLSFGSVNGLSDRIQTGVVEVLHTCANDRSRVEQVQVGHAVHCLKTFNGWVEVAASVGDRKVVLLQQVEAADLLLPGGPPRGQARRRCFRRSCEPRRMSG